MRDDKKFNILRGTLSQILITVICTIIIIPIVEVILSALKVAGGNLLDALIDAFFAYSATADTRTVFSIVILAVLTVVVLTNITQTPGKKEIFPEEQADKPKETSISRKLAGLERELAELSESAPGDPTALSKLKEISQSLNEIRKREHRSKLLLLWLSRISKCIMVCWAVMICYSWVIPSMFSVQFDHTLDIIAPYAAQDEVLLLRSDWRLMDTKEDFDSINARLLSIRDRYDLY